MSHQRSSLADYNDMNGIQMTTLNHHEMNVPQCDHPAEASTMHKEVVPEGLAETTMSSGVEVKQPSDEESHLDTEMNYQSKNEKLGDAKTEHVTNSTEDVSLLVISHEI